MKRKNQDYKFRRNGQSKSSYNYQNKSTNLRPRQELTQQAQAFCSQLDETKNDVDIELERFNALELKTLTVQNKTNLMRINGLVKLCGTSNGCALKMLVDGGASHSFINMRVLPKPVIEQLESDTNIKQGVYNLETTTVCNFKRFKL